MSVNYTPPPTLRNFIKHYEPGALFYDWVVGPVGSGKTTAIFFKLAFMAALQAKGPDGIRRSRAVVVRNTMPQLRDTTLTSWRYWFKHGQAGEWQETNKTFILRFNDVECEVLFRALDTPDDVARVLSLEITFAILDEFVQIPQAIVDALSARLGRYPSAKDGGATNWGMWGASNPDTEDNWWYDRLHNHLPASWKYYLQPSGLSPDAENLENLPGGRGYYTNQMDGKALAWIKQFIEAEWGYSIAGTPVVPSFRADLHVARYPLKFDPLLKLVIGIDPGYTHSAVIFGQMDMNGQLRVLGELIQQGIAADALVRDRLKPYIARRFPGADIVIAPDPASKNAQGASAETVLKVLRKHFKVEIEDNNRLPLRMNAIEHFTNRLTQLGPALLIDGPQCPILVRALKGGWRYEMDNKRNVVKDAAPEKNGYSHAGDGFGYLCRYFHRNLERASRYPGGIPPARQQLLVNYHMR